ASRTATRSCSRPTRRSTSTSASSPAGSRRARRWSTSTPRATRRARRDRAIAIDRARRGRRGILAAMTATPGTKKPIGRWILLGLWCVSLFVIPSAAVVDRGAPAWAAAIVGALSFPLAPIAWHVLAERARKRRAAAAKIAPKATLTAADRFVFRTIAI